ncbi:MAG: DNA glycosylase AlkZ-like family protein, partial [bacterium]
AIHARRGFEKVYDLAERVHGSMPERPAREDVVAWACRSALERLGAATAREIAHFAWAISPTEAGAWCRASARRGEIAEVALERLGRAPRAGFAQVAWKHDAARVRIDETPRALAPFDPLIRERGRLAELFGFNYRFEAFVPAAKRVHGYYTMPILAGERFVARLDLASDRDKGTLRVDRAWHEPTFPMREADRCARSAAARLARQLQFELAWPMRPRAR